MTEFLPSAAIAGSADLQFAVGSEPDRALLSRTSAAARRLERLEADVELRDRLMWRDYSGPEWEMFQRALIEYGYPIMLGWLRSGQLIKELGYKKIIGPSELLEEAREDDSSHDIAVDVTLVAVKNFREKVLIPGVWRPDKGASLKTFFIGRCLLDFANVYRRWRNGHKKKCMVVSDAVDEISDQSAERKIMRRRQAALLLGDDVVSLTVFTMISEGYTYAEIGKKLDMTAKSVERRVARIREKVRSRG